MAGYTKLFQDIVASSIWDEDDKTRLVWITILALKDRNHFVRGTVRWLALSARVSMEECESALQKLSSPDAQSRSKEHEGRRISVADGGWTVLNGEKYSRMLSKAERDAYNAAKQAEYRKRKKHVKDSGTIAGARRALKEGFAHYNNPPEGTDHFKEDPLPYPSPSS